MKFQSMAGRQIRLSYVASAHPAPDLAGVISGLNRYSTDVRRRLDTPRIGVTLVLPDPAATELDESAPALRSLQRALADCGVEVTGIHGVPVRMYDPKRRYGVFRPDWAEPARLSSTVRLARILANLLPDDATGGVVSTIPLFWRTREDTSTRQSAESALLRAADHLLELEADTGKRVRIVVEPEPGCALETTLQASEALTAIIDRNPEAISVIGLCLDTSHMAVQFEDETEILPRLGHLKPPVVKLQLANALRVPDPQKHVDALEEFVDPSRLHQTRERRPDGRVYGVDDLSAAIPGGLPGDAEWRVHYHMPVYLSDETTQEWTSRVLRTVLSSVESVENIETETYTWPMLPPRLRPPGESWIAEGLARELMWTRERLFEAGFSLIE